MPSRCDRRYHCVETCTCAGRTVVATSPLGLFIPCCMCCGVCGVMSDSSASTVVLNRRRDLRIVSSACGCCVSTSNVRDIRGVGARRSKDDAEDGSELRLSFEVGSSHHHDLVGITSEATEIGSAQYGPYSH